MTGRQDLAPVVSVRTETMHKELQNLKGQDDIFRKQEVVKQPKRSTTKSTRPAMELYNPRKVVSSKNGIKVHFADDTVTRKTSPPPSSHPLPTELKSALKRSKSFTAEESRDLENIGFEKEAFPIEYHGLIRRAILDPNALSCQKLMELVRLISCKAVESPKYAVPAARLCFSIIEKEHDHTFLESLQNCCREWFNERDKLLRTPFSNSISSSLRRWTAYVTFIQELYLHVKNQHSQIAPTSGAKAISPHPNSPIAHLAMTLQTLLFECATIILKPPSVNSEGEMEIIRRLLTSVGMQLETDSSARMDQLMQSARDAFLAPSASASVRKSLLEMIELHASQWQMTLSQTLYYFPYTKL